MLSTPAAEGRRSMSQIRSGLVSIAACALALVVPMWGFAQPKVSVPSGFTPVREARPGGAPDGVWQRSSADETLKIARLSRPLTLSTSEELSNLPYHFVGSRQIAGCLSGPVTVENYYITSPIRNAYVHDMRFRNDSGFYIFVYARMGSNDFPSDVEAFFREGCAARSLAGLIRRWRGLHVGLGLPT